MSAPTATSSPGPGAGPAGPGPWLPPRAAEPAPARPPGQAATFVVCALALGLAGHAIGQLPVAVLGAVALGLGVVVGLAGDLRRIFATLPGAFVGFVVTVAVGVLLAVGAGFGLPYPPWQAFPFLFALVTGLDWRRVDRLRQLVFLAGLPVVLVVGLERGWALPAAIAWFAAAVGALWLLEQDRRAALDAPVPLVPGAAPPTGPPLDLLRTLGIALLLGLTAAFLLGNPSCSLRPPRADPPNFRPPNVDPPNLPTPSGDPSGGDPSGSGRAFREYELEGRNQERGYEIGAGGQRRFEDDETGRSDTVDEEEPGTQVARDANGDEVARLDEDGVVAVDPDATGPGSTQRFRVDGEGRFYVEGDDGTRSYLGEEDGRPVLRDADDRVVARSDGSDDHVVVLDPDGKVLVDDPDGRIPVPDGAVRDGVGATGEPDGRSFRSEGDRTIVTDPDGSVRVHDRDEQGRTRLRVEEPGRPTRTYVFEPDGRKTWVNTYDEDGRLIDRYLYDPDAVTGSGEAGGDPDSTGGGASDPDDASKDDGGGWSPKPWLILGGAALVAAVATWLYLRRRDRDAEPTDRTWAEELQARLEELGRERGRARRPSETVLEYTAALAGGVLPDEQLPAVGRTLSAALFGPTQPSTEVQAWARATVEAAAEAHPLTGRRRRPEPAAPAEV